MEKLILISLLTVYSVFCSAMEVPVYDFPIGAYSQNANDYLPSKDMDFSKNLLTSDYQNTQSQQFYNHYFATEAKSLSPLE